uniref:peptidoglycan editing factor PgeF n=1 Tax=Acetatifactor sp. TaxID=1872090 RepID=UPI00405662DE
MYHIIRAERTNGPVMKQESFQIAENTVMEYLTFDILEKTGIVKHMFTTRTGGVSEGIYSSMNLSFTRGDNPESVLENYKRVAKVLGCQVEDMIASHQTHTTNIRRVTAADRGKGIVVSRDYEDIDGLITNEKGIALVTFYADCVPLYFVDPEHQAIGLAHSGWRGTVQQMGARMVEAMNREFGSHPEKMFAAIGPSICQECYEVSEEVAIQFERVFGPEVLVPGKASDKYQLDLWRANVLVLTRAGIPVSRIAVTDVCTCHNSQYMFSHRASEGKRGNLAAVLMLKNS